MDTEMLSVLKGDCRFNVVPCGLTGPEIAERTNVSGDEIALLHGDELPAGFWSRLHMGYPGFIAVDFTHPNAVNANAVMYRDHNVSFVMGTTGGDREALTHLYDGAEFGSCAVIAPNMAKQVVLFQEMMRFAANNFPGGFNGYILEVVESHQQGKADTSGTAKDVVKQFNMLGIPFEPSQIVMVREPEQQKAMGIPPEALSGHGWHTYTVKSAGGSVLFQFTHNINGRGIYAEGTRDAILFLGERLKHGCRGQVFTMANVLMGH
jgi:4-hydroxy-tetrahydrodipicolinate reductase